MSDPAVAAIRSFNRFYTRQIGLLEEHIAKTRFTLAEGRVLYEIGQKEPTTARAIAGELGLDTAYLSRLLKALLKLGLIVTEASSSDRRSSEIRLTTDGRTAVAEIDAMNDAAVNGVIADLSGAARHALVAAMSSVQSLLGGARPRAPAILRPSRLGEIGWLIHRQALGYNQQYGWNSDFEGLIAGIYSAYHSSPQEPPRDLWVAEQSGEVVGSIFVQPSDGLPGSAQLRMLFVEIAARGQGIGGALVAQAVSFSRENGYQRMRLWTHENQVAARRLYAAAGFQIVETTPEMNFGKELLGEIWEMRF